MYWHRTKSLTLWGSCIAEIQSLNSCRSENIASQCLPCTVSQTELWKTPVNVYVKHSTCRVWLGNLLAQALKPCARQDMSCEEQHAKTWPAPDKCMFYSAAQNSFIRCPSLHWTVWHATCGEKNNGLEKKKGNDFIIKRASKHHGHKWETRLNMFLHLCLKCFMCLNSHQAVSADSGLGT